MRLIRWFNESYNLINYKKGKGNERIAWVWNDKIWVHRLNGLFVCEMIRFGSIDWFHFCENWIARTHQDMCFVPWIYTIWNHQASGPSLLWWWHGNNDPILKHSVLV